MLISGFIYQISPYILGVIKIDDLFETLSSSCMHSSYTYIPFFLSTFLLNIREVRRDAVPDSQHESEVHDESVARLELQLSEVVLLALSELNDPSFADVDPVQIQECLEPLVCVLVLNAGSKKVPENGVCNPSVFKVHHEPLNRELPEV